jgi:hypothetical protein
MEEKKMKRPERKKEKLSVKVKQTWPVAGKRARANSP